MLIHPFPSNYTVTIGCGTATGKIRGKLILVDFWGLWCTPCLEGMPEIKTVYEKYKDRGLMVVGVLCDHRVDEVRAWLGERGFDWPQLVDRSLTEETMTEHPIAVRYAIGGFPTLWFIDREGILSELGKHGELDVQIRRFLAE